MAGLGKMSLIRTKRASDSVDMCDASDLGRESPILFKAVKNKSEQIEIGDKIKLSLADIHKKLHHYLKDKTYLSRRDLKTYLDQVQKLNPEDPKNRWLLMKVKGLLNYILKRRSDFQCSIVTGEITIYEKSASQEVSNVGDVTLPPKLEISAVSQSFDIPSNFLTNTDFMTVRTDSVQMDAGCSYNPSQDLFSDTLQSLHSFSQENYQILKQLTNNNVNSNVCQNEVVFKLPEPINKVDTVFKAHETVEQNYSSLVSAIQFTPSNDDIAEDEVATKNEDFNIFTNLSMTNEELQQELETVLKDTENWISDIVHDLKQLAVSADSTSHNTSMDAKEYNKVLNESSSSSIGLPLETHHSEENFKIIREVCSEYKKSLERHMTKNKNLKDLMERLSFSDYS